jgi:hypothetical protein
VEIGAFTMGTKALLSPAIYHINSVSAGACPSIHCAMLVQLFYLVLSMNITLRTLNIFLGRLFCEICNIITNPKLLNNFV